MFESDSASFRDIYRVQADGTGLLRLTSNPQGNFEPAVSPDGQSIAFVSSRDGDAEVYVMGAHGGAVRRLTAFHRDDWAPRWSPDGGRIAFLSNRDGVDRVYVVAADGTGLRALGARLAALIASRELEDAGGSDADEEERGPRRRALYAAVIVALLGAGAGTVAWRMAVSPQLRASVKDKVQGWVRSGDNRISDEPAPAVK